MFTCAYNYSLRQDSCFMYYYSSQKSWSNCMYLVNVKDEYTNTI